MFKSLIIWLGTITLLILILYSKTSDINWSNIELGLLILDVLGGIVAWAYMVSSFDKLLHKKYSNLEATSASLSFLLLTLVTGIGIILFFITQLQVKKQEIPITNTKIASYKLINSGLKFGSSGDDVKIVQAAFAQDKNLYPSGIVNGYYGILTQNAVINFQRKFSLNQSGVFNDLTTNKFNEVYGSKTRSYYLKLFPTASFQINNLSDNQNVLTNTNQTGQNSTIDNTPYGQVKQISKYEYTQRLADEPNMGTPNEILIALNNFRNNNSKSSLTWDNDLASWAQSRAQSFANAHQLDQHVGFEAEAPSKYDQFGKRFSGFGENAFYGGKLAASHLIEWVFAGDTPHKEGMLCDCNVVGIGIATNDNVNYGADLIFGKFK
jgi:peptidoglycan hydrolase-like protein with peptidoglycan-binding domain